VVGDGCPHDELLACPSLRKIATLILWIRT
jgi:hypothetical protein